MNIWRSNLVFALLIFINIFHRINNDFTFDDAMANQFQCTVRSFDPRYGIYSQFNEFRTSIYPWIFKNIDNCVIHPIFLNFKWNNLKLKLKCQGKVDQLNLPIVWKIIFDIRWFLVVKKRKFHNSVEAMFDYMYIDYPGIYVCGLRMHHNRRI